MRRHKYGLKNWSTEWWRRVLNSKPWVCKFHGERDLSTHPSCFSFLKLTLNDISSGPVCLIQPWWKLHLWCRWPWMNSKDSFSLVFSLYFLSEFKHLFIWLYYWFQEMIFYRTYTKFHVNFLMFYWLACRPWPCSSYRLICELILILFNYLFIYIMWISFLFCFLLQEQAI